MHKLHTHEWLKWHDLRLDKWCYRYLELQVSISVLFLWTRISELWKSAIHIQASFTVNVQTAFHTLQGRTTGQKMSALPPCLKSRYCHAKWKSTANLSGQKLISTFCIRLNIGQESIADQTVKFKRFKREYSITECVLSSSALVAQLRLKLVYFLIHGRRSFWYFL